MIDIGRILELVTAMKQLTLKLEKLSNDQRLEIANF